MSLLQKAVRRGELRLALKAAATLLDRAPDRVWRRVGCIAYEDLGHGSIDVVSFVTAALQGKRFRSNLGSEWQVLSFLIAHLVAAAKCRAADDLLMCAERHPDYVRARHDLPGSTTRSLLDVMGGSDPLPIRALAAWFAIGTVRRPSPFLTSSVGDPTAVFDWMNEMGEPHSVVEIAREGHRKTGEVLAPFVALLSSARREAITFEWDDEFPPQVMIGQIPSWALDMYTREGRIALVRFLKGKTETARWVRGNMAAQERINFLGNIVFRVEGGLCRRRLRWKTADWLREMVDKGSHGPACPDATELLDLMRADLPLLNVERANVL